MEDEASWPAVRGRVEQCFGVAKFFKAYSLPQDLAEVKKALPSLIGDRQFESFSIRANRADKRFPVTSEEINRDLGAYVKDITGARVDLTNRSFRFLLKCCPSGYTST